MAQTVNMRLWMAAQHIPDIPHWALYPRKIVTCKTTCHGVKTINLLGMAGWSHMLQAIGMGIEADLWHCCFPNTHSLQRQMLLIRLQHIAFAPHGLKIAGLFGVILDLAAQAGDLHINGAFLCGIVAAQIGHQTFAADRLTGV